MINRGQPRSAPKQLAQPALHRLLIRFPGALNPRLDLAPLDLMRCRRPFHGNREPPRRSGRILRESAAPELRHGKRGRLVQRACSDFDRVSDVVSVDERNEAGLRGGHDFQCTANGEQTANTKGVPTTCSWRITGLWHNSAWFGRLRRGNYFDAATIM